VQKPNHVQAPATEAHHLYPIGVIRRDGYTLKLPETLEQLLNGLRPVVRRLVEERPDDEGAAL
jgi:hypothetical protein